MLEAAENDLILIQLRSIHIKSSSFNINALNDEDSLRNFGLVKEELAHIHELVKCNKPVTKRDTCKYSPLTGTCILLPHLSSPRRWAELNYMFGMKGSALSEVFYEKLNSLFDNCTKIVTDFRNDLIKDRAGLYSTAVTEKGGLLDKCVGFMDGIKIQITRNGGPTSRQERCIAVIRE